MATAAEIEIKKLADLHYAAQTTGVNGAVLDAQIKKVFEITGRDNTAKFGDMEIQDNNLASVQLIAEYGYTSGTEFYDNGTLGQTPDDPGLKVYFDAVDRAINEYGYLPSTEANMKEYSGKINPDTGEEYKFMMNDNVANAALIQQGLLAQGLTTADTVASTPSSTPEWQQLASTKAAETYDDTEERVSEYLGGTPTYENALQWAATERKTKVETTPGGSGNNDTGIITGGTATDSDSGGITGGFTQDPNTLDIPDSAVLPTFTNSVSQVSDGASGTYTVPAQTFEDNITNQVKDLSLIHI